MTVSNRKYGGEDISRRELLCCSKVWWKARELGSTPSCVPCKPSWHMTSSFDSPERSHPIVFGHCSISKYVPCCQSGHGHISSSSQPLQQSSTIVNNHRGVWWASKCLSSENLAAGWRLGGRKWTLFFKLWDFKEDDSWQMHRSWWPLVLQTRIGSERDAHQPLVIVSFTGCSWARSWGFAARHLASTKWETVSFIFTPPCLLSYFCSSAWELASLGKGFHGGRVIGTLWVPMGMVDLPSAPERWCGSVAAFSCFTIALTWHDPQLIWILENLKPSLYSFFVFYVLFFFCGVATEWRSFISLAFLLRR